MVRPPAARHNKGVRTSPSGKGIGMDSATVALIDDEPDVLALLQDVLESQGFTVLSASKPDVLERAVSLVRPALFLVDLMLPGTTGVMLASRLRQRGFTHTPMIAMSASPLMSRFAVESGLFTDAIDKPFDVDTLVERVARYAA